MYGVNRKTINLMREEKVHFFFFSIEQKEKREEPACAEKRKNEYTVVTIIPTVYVQSNKKTDRIC